MERVLEFRSRGGVAKYKVRWAGSSEEDDSWLDEEAMPRSSIREYWQGAVAGKRPAPSVSDSTASRKKSRGKGKGVAGK